MPTCIVRSLVFSGVLLLAAAAAHSEKAESKVIEEGSTVSLEYTLKLDDGSTADTNVGGEPLKYQQGRSQILPALERELAGLKVNDTKQVTLSAEDGYGPVNPEAFQEVKPDMVPENARKAGARLVAQDGSGRKRIARVHEVTDDQIVLDLNHPLAGQTLHFDVRVVEIE